MNPLKMITLSGYTYDALVVIDGDIVLQSLHQDLVFEGGYTKVCDELKAEWWKQGAIGSERDYVLEYENEAMLQYVRDNEGLVIENQNN